jgi:hypothetical protein
MDDALTPAAYPLRQPRDGRARRLSWVALALVVAGGGLRDAAADVSVPHDGHSNAAKPTTGADAVGAAKPTPGGATAAAKSTAGAGAVGAAKSTVAAVCGTHFSPGRAVGSVSASDVQEALLGASASGATLLYLRSPYHACVADQGGATLLLADRVDASGDNYAVSDVTSLPALAGFSRREATMTVSPDGRAVIGAGARGGGFLVATRSRLGATDFAAPIAGPFATLDAALPEPAWVGWPVLSADGLAFYYKIEQSGDAGRDGIYESVRDSTSADFPVGTRMPDVVQAWGSVTGVAPDRLTLYVTRDFGTHLLTRASTSAPFAQHDGSPWPVSAYRVTPIDGCRLIGTCEPGGCWREDICVWSATAK